MNTRRPDGFTLIELLVALTLFGLISVVIMGGLRFGTRVWETGETRAQAAAEIEAVQSILRRYLAQATMPRLIGRKARDVPLFDGGAERLRFVTVTPAHVGIGGLYQIELAKVDGVGDEAASLQLTWHVFRPDDPRAIEFDPEEDTLAGGRRTLLADVKTVTFAYYKTDGPGFDPSEWEETWEDEGELPGLIAMNVEFAETGEAAGRTWPVLVVQTRLSGADR